MDTSISWCWVTVKTLTLLAAASQLTKSTVDESKNKKKKVKSVVIVPKQSTVKHATPEDLKNFFQNPAACQATGIPQPQHKKAVDNTPAARHTTNENKKLFFENPKLSQEKGIPEVEPPGPTFSPVHSDPPLKQADAGAFFAKCKLPANNAKPHEGDAPLPPQDTPPPDTPPQDTPPQDTPPPTAASEQHTASVSAGEQQETTAAEATAEARHPAPHDEASDEAPPSDKAVQVPAGEQQISAAAHTAAEPMETTKVGISGNDELDLEELLEKEVNRPNDAKPEPRPQPPVTVRTPKQSQAEQHQAVQQTPAEISDQAAQEIDQRSQSEQPQTEQPQTEQHPPAEISNEAAPEIDQHSQAEQHPQAETPGPSNDDEYMKMQSIAGESNYSFQACTWYRKWHGWTIIRLRCQWWRTGRTWRKDEERESSSTTGSSKQENIQSNSNDDLDPQLQASTPPKEQQQHEPQEPEVEVAPNATDMEDTEEKCVNIIKLTGCDIDLIFSDLNTAREVLMLFTNKKISGETYVTKQDSSEVLGKVLVDKQTCISNLGELRACECFHNASREIKDLWKKRILQEKKPLFLWEMLGIEVFEKPLTIRGKTKTGTQIALNRLVSHHEATVPSLDLKETALYFMQRLSEEDLQRLGQTMAHLDQCTVRVGGTCSGTDIAVSVTRATLEAFSKHFNASWLTMK